MSSDAHAPRQDEHEAPRRAAVPRYVAIVSDGNARWAQARGLSLREGHEGGAGTVIARGGGPREVLRGGLRLYVFAPENWTGPRAKMAELLAMLPRRIAADTPRLH